MSDAGGQGGPFPGRLQDPEGPLGRQLYLLPVGALSEIPAAVSELAAKHFVLFLALDARNVPDAHMLPVARRLLEMGLAYLVAWGPDCERVHDRFDDAEIENELKQDSGSVVMTTWHDKDSLEEALWFALFSAYPAPPYDEDCSAVVAVAVANPDWQDTIHRYLADVPSLSRAVGACW